MGQRCKLGFCDGPNDAGCGNGAIEGNEECDDGPDNADEAACKSDCTLNVCGDGKVGPGEACDDGNRDDTDGCGNDCTLGSCGDGKIDPGEECDDGGQNSDDAACTTMCKRGVCGDGLLQSTLGEACDDGEETASCNDDCELPACGDGNVNEAFGESCDDGDTQRSKACMENCTLPILWDDAESAIPGYSVTQGGNNGASYTSDWMRSTDKAASGATAWNSGEREGTTQFACADDCYGSTRLETNELDLTGLSAPIRLEFMHRWTFDDANVSSYEGDGGTVEVFADGMWTSVAPDGGYPHTIDDEDGCMNRTEPNPLLGEGAWGHESPGADDEFVPAQLDLSAFAGKTIRLGFHVSYDCSDLDVTEGWWLDDIVVWNPITL